MVFLRDQGWDIDIAAHVRRGGVVLGICGGYQILGRTVSDPDGIEGPPSQVPGLNLLDVETLLTADKTLAEVSGTETQTGAPVTGYEMHVGKTHGPGIGRPMLDLLGRFDGAVSPDGRVSGCYVHGLFASDAFRTEFLQRLRPDARAEIAYEASIDRVLDDLADHLESYLDIEGMISA